MNPFDDRMFLVLPVPFRRQAGALLFEEQACNGLERWAGNFSHVVVAAPVMREGLASANSSITWRDTSELPSANRLTFVPLPWAYSPVAFARNWSAVRRQFRQHIQDSEFLQFAIGGLIGDWAGLAALEAIRLNRRFAIHTDRVEHKVLLEVTKNHGGLRRIKTRLISRLMERYHRHLISRCALGLWHGSDCYEAYAPWSRVNRLIHDVHTKAEDCISPEQLRNKLDGISSTPTFDIIYAGRLDAMKAPVDWIKAIGVARDLGAPIRATWFGEGSLRADAEKEVTRLSLEGIVSLPGFTSDRELLLTKLRSAHLLVFTHVTPESPRILLESLISGTPIAGYTSAYAADLVDHRGGGMLVPVHDFERLGRAVAELASDRPRLAELTREAAVNGQRFNDQAVFAERSELIKQYCSAPAV